MPPNSAQRNTSPLVRSLFVASIMLVIVSWYTTFEGMSLYLSRWFALFASLGVQSALLFVAWLIGFRACQKSPRTKS